MSNCGLNRHGQLKYPSLEFFQAQVNRQPASQSNQESRGGGMLPFEDKRWESLNSGFGVQFNPLPLLQRLFVEGGSEGLWRVFWSELCNQGELGTAEYATLPWLVEYLMTCSKFDVKAAMLIADIELWRSRNADVPDYLRTGYEHALRRLPDVVYAHRNSQLSDSGTQMLATLTALAGQNRWFAEAYFHLSRPMIEDLMMKAYGRTTWF